jgi:preprotein translocase subunit SecE
LGCIAALVGWLVGAFRVLAGSFGSSDAVRVRLVLQGELSDMANVSVETVSTTADKAKLGAAALLVIAAVVVFYVLGKQDLWLRVLSLLALMAVAVALYFTSESGKQLIAYGKDSAKEVRKVVWPTRKEAMQMTGYVFAFVLVMAVFLWVTDKTLEWVLYDLLLGWKR